MALKSVQQCNKLIRKAIQETIMLDDISEKKLRAIQFKYRIMTGETVWRLNDFAKCFGLTAKTFHIDDFEEVVTSSDNCVVWCFTTEDAVVSNCTKASCLWSTFLVLKNSGKKNKEFEVYFPGKSGSLYDFVSDIPAETFIETFDELWEEGDEWFDNFYLFELEEYIDEEISEVLDFNLLHLQSKKPLDISRKNFSARQKKYLVFNEDDVKKYRLDEEESSDDEE